MSEDIVELKQVKKLFNALFREENSVFYGVDDIIQFVAKSAVDPRYCLLVLFYPPWKYTCTQWKVGVFWLRILSYFMRIHLKKENGKKKWGYRQRDFEQNEIKKKAQSKAWSSHV